MKEFIIENFVLLQFIASLIAIIIPIILYFWNQNSRKKEFSYYIFDSFPLISNSINTKSLEIFCNGTPIKNSNVISIQFKNRGNKFIDANDFITPIKIQADTKPNIIDVSISSKNPDTLKPIVSFNDQEIMIEALDLNKNDSFILNIITEGEFGNPKVKSRIKGVSELLYLNKKYVKVSAKWHYLALGFWLSIIFYSILFLILTLIL